MKKSPVERLMKSMLKSLRIYESQVRSERIKEGLKRRKNANLPG